MQKLLCFFTQHKRLTSSILLTLLAGAGLYFSFVPVEYTHEKLPLSPHVAANASLDTLLDNEEDSLLSPHSNLAPLATDLDGNMTAAYSIKKWIADKQPTPPRVATNATLEERIQQLDCTLVATMRRLAIPAENILLHSIELRTEALQAYHFQQISITTPYTSAFITDVFNSIRPWNNDVRLSKGQTDARQGQLWRVYLQGIATHEILLIPDTLAPSTASNARPATNSTKPVQLDSDTDIRFPALPAKRYPDAYMAIVIDDMGENISALQQLIALNFPVGIAIWPHATHKEATAEMAYAAGLDILLHQPMEPIYRKGNRLAPDTLSAQASAQIITDTLARNMAKIPHVIGFNNHMGSLFTQNSWAVNQLLTAATTLNMPNLVILDSFTHPDSILAPEARKRGWHTYRRDIFLDAVPDSKEAVFEQLAAAEKIAHHSGQVLVIGHPLPKTLSALQEWQQQRDTHIQIVPLSWLATE